jgi:8-oxo-dGTP pyrophosphatase MutT (NUDIX family)
VAAVCYRIRKGTIEFLLVQTRNERWIFPKGGVESGLTHAESAALEAVEEAGVHGRIEAVPFARYFRRRPDQTAVEGIGDNEGQLEEPELAVVAFLCEVSRLEAPQESYRNPTWFPAEKAKSYLLKKRTPEFGMELARIIDRAAARIRRMHLLSTSHGVGQAHSRQGIQEALREVRFEAAENAEVNGSPLTTAHAGQIRRQNPSGSKSAGRGIPAAEPFYAQPRLRLGSGIPSSAGILQKVQFIDEGSPGNRAKAPARLAQKRGK